ncbi:MAG: glycerol acyltransferase [Flavobacteriia bacterium]|nr:MAG: glycerol acyltransferase [Flavobacteriia bacterium]
MSRQDLIDIEALIKSKNPRLLKWLPRFVIAFLKRKLHQKEINTFLTTYGHLQDHAFCEALINYFEIEIAIEGLENIPAAGGAILALNHPLGGMDGIALIHALRDKRPDVALIVNDLLLNIKQLSNLFVGINKFGRNDGGVRQNIRSAFEKEQLVIIFPAGMVTRIHYGQIIEAEWKKTFVSYARQLERPIVPIYIDGRLSKAFYRLNRWRKRIGIKANIEMFLLADEMFKQKKGKISFVIGAALTPQQLPAELTDYEAANWVKNHVYSLKTSDETNH